MSFMKKYLTLAAAAMIIAGCAKNAPEAETYLTPDDQVSTPEPIQFGSNVVTSVTKTLGPIDEWDANQTIGVFGYMRIANMDYRNAFIEDVKAKSPVGDGPIVVLNSNNNNEPFYYNATNAFDFYAYYADNALRNTPVKATDRVYATVRIDGTQDIMLAKADPAADIAAAKAKYADDPEKLARINQVTDRDAYSGYAARRYVHPNLKFEHQLSRFNVTVTPMTADAQNIKVTGLKMNKCYTDGTLTIVSATDRGLVVTPNNVAALDFRQKIGSNLSRISTTNPVSLSGTEIGTALNVGVGLLLMPQESYELNMNFEQTGTATGNNETFAITPAMIEGNTATAFEAGKQYNINIKLYGFQKIEISVELTAWEDGGDIVIDEDKPIE